VTTRKRNLLLIVAQLVGAFGLLAIVIQAAHASNGGGSTLEFDGDDFVTVPHNANLNLTTFTFEAWIKLDNTTGCKAIFSKRDDAGGYMFHISDAYMVL
jgi:hypothetical protein